eukprot:CAMPEP_0177587594 /NCGR_PEP_ID=MMETSP0419_2-20121207/5743_1 /TAXON_ID=582737 /ORGANISM="Tetraselmis sp., Strain GSL018" /LENGTH=602 /DNA_ID=CAMNT_0019077671 /DNA_START=248 /DNA_END=2054 /DNA_ORIENTATION=+
MHHISPSSVLEPAGAFPKHFPGTKVCATLGPACHDVDTLARLLNSGMTSARVDLTWGNVEFHKRSLRNLAEACKRTKRLCGVMVDTLGREVYVKREFEHDSMGWPVSREALEFKKGHQVTLTTRDAEASSELLPVTFPGFPSMCQIGDEIFIGRYLVTGAESASCYARVVDVSDTDIVCELESDASMSGLLTIFHVERSSHSVSNLQNTLPALMESDIEALRQLKDEFDIDWLCLSYARSAQDVLDARQILDELGMADTEIMAKVETRQALLEFKNILRHADGIIISRGNIGLDVQPEKMCLVQKTIISACNVVGKPVCITRVVDTMANTPRPTRAEATDVANAVLDGVDGILLGAETLRGKYPVETVKCVTSIAIQAEKNFDHQKHFEFLMDESLDESALFGEDSGLWAPMQGNIPTHLTLTTAHSSSSLSGTATAAGGVTSSKSVSSFNEVAGAGTESSRVPELCLSAPLTRPSDPLVPTRLSLDLVLSANAPPCVAHLSVYPGMAPPPEPSLPDPGGVESASSAGGASLLVPFLGPGCAFFFAAWAPLTFCMAPAQSPRALHLLARSPAKLDCENRPRPQSLLFLLQAPWPSMRPDRAP